MVVFQIKFICKHDVIWKFYDVGYEYQIIAIIRSILNIRETMIMLQIQLRITSIDCFQYCWIHQSIFKQLYGDFTTKLYLPLQFCFIKASNIHTLLSVDYFVSWESKTIKVMKL